MKASIHTLITTFDDEEWRIITLFVNHLDSQLKYIDIFAPSCGSIGDFTDIKKLDEGYAMTRQMKHYNFPVRNFDGTFYEQVHPFDPSSFAVKVHLTGALLFTPHHSQLTLLQHIIIQSPFLKKPVQLLSDIPKYWIEDDGTMCLDESHRWRSADTIAWLRTRGLHSVPNSIKADIGDLVYNGPRGKASDDSAVLTPPLGVLSSMLEVGHPMIRHPAYEFLLPMSRRLNRESAPMSRRLNREMPLRSQGLSWFRTNFHSSATTLTVMIYE